MSNVDLPQKIGKYRIEKKLSEGGMGVVYKARDEEHKLSVAIKVLHSQLGANLWAALKFHQEKLIANQVAHPGIVKVHDSGELPGVGQYLVMEFVEGEPLRRRLTGPMPEADIYILGRLIASVLAAVHKQGIVHRDLKPENVMLTPDQDVTGGQRIKLLDFGIARYVDVNPGAGSPSGTMTGMIMGTPSYMAPEQIRSAGKATDKADVYSLGVILYEMVHGSPPFTASEPMLIVPMHLTTKPAPLRQLHPKLKPELGDLVHRMLEKDAELRPTAQEVADKLVELMKSRASVPTIPNKSKALPVILALLFISVVVALASFATLRPTHNAEVQNQIELARQAIIDRKWDQAEDHLRQGSTLARSRRISLTQQERMDELNVQVVTEKRAQPLDEQIGTWLQNAALATNRLRSLPRKLSPERVSDWHAKVREARDGIEAATRLLAEIPRSSTYYYPRRDQVVTAGKELSSLSPPQPLKVAHAVPGKRHPDPRGRQTRPQAKAQPVSEPPPDSVPIAEPMQAPELPTPPPAALEPALIRNRLREAQQLFLDRRYADSLALAHSVTTDASQTEDVQRAWLYVGLSSCGTKNLLLVNQAYDIVYKLDYKQQIETACQTFGIVCQARDRLPSQRCPRNSFTAP